MARCWRSAAHSTMRIPAPPVITRTFMTRPRIPFHPQDRTPTLASITRCHCSCYDAHRFVYGRKPGARQLRTSHRNLSARISVRRERETSEAAFHQQSPQQHFDGKSFTVQTPECCQHLLRSPDADGAVTHAFDMEQRLVGMSYKVETGSLTRSQRHRMDTSPRPGTTCSS